MIALLTGLAWTALIAAAWALVAWLIRWRQRRRALERRAWQERQAPVPWWD